MKQLSIRARLLVTLVLLAALGLAVADVITAASLRSFLIQRVDQQLVAAQVPLAEQLSLTLGGPRRGGPNRTLLPPGTYGDLRHPDGSLQLPPVVYGSESGGASEGPKLTAKLIATAAAADKATTVTVPAAVGSGRYRALIQPQNGGGAFTVAVPLHDVDQTLRRLRLLETVVALLVLVLLGGVAYWAVRIGLRPLEQMEETAGAIAAGDLSRRVEDANPKTEVGRLGGALNDMLGQIEQAFAERAASEERLRRFLADASHELRTPLTSIRGYAELFRRGADKRPEDLAKAMRRIEDEANRMGVLVEDLLLLARLDEGRPFERVPVDVTAVARDAVDDARARDPEREIRLEAWPSIVVAGDGARLHQVAANLLANALEHTPPQSPVEVRVSKGEGTAVLEVADHGPGLTPDEATRVFDRFFRADPSRTRASGGAGLGLAIVAAIVHAHDGTVAVRTAPGQGATFRVTLPLANGSGPLPPPAPPGPPADQPPYDEPPYDEPLYDEPPYVT